MCEDECLRCIPDFQECFKWDPEPLVGKTVVLPDSEETYEFLGIGWDKDHGGNWYYMVRPKSGGAQLRKVHPSWEPKRAPKLVKEGVIISEDTVVCPHCSWETDGRQFHDLMDAYSRPIHCRGCGKDFHATLGKTTVRATFLCQPLDEEGRGMHTWPQSLFPL